MKLIYDKNKLSGKYDDRNLTISESGKHHYPSKKMFIEFLKKFKDVKGTVKIDSMSDWNTGEVTIFVELKYKVANSKDLKDNGYRTGGITVAKKKKK